LVAWLADGAGDSEANGDGFIEGVALDCGTRRENFASAFAWALSECRPASDERNAGSISGDIVGFAVADSI